MRKSKNCITDSQLRSILANSLTKSEKEAIEEHIAGCQDCRRRLLEVKLLKRGVDSFAEKRQLTDHADEILISAYFDGGLSKEEREELESHLTICDDCWEQFVALEALQEGLDRDFLPEPDFDVIEATRKIFPGKGIDRVNEFYRENIANLRKFFGEKLALRFAGVALVAVIFVGIALSLFYLQSGQKPLLRNAPIPEMKTINLLQPSPGEKIRSREITFSWQVLPRISQYHFMLLNDIGDVIFEEFTDRTYVILDLGIQPAVRRSYFWRVEGIRDNGDKMESELSYFVYSGQNP